MAKANTTFGEFFDAVNRTNNADAKIWLDQWAKLLDEARWQDVGRKTPLSDDEVIFFTQDMRASIRERLQSISGEALYEAMFQSGRNFLEEIRQIAAQFDVIVGDIVDIPLTFSELMQQADQIVETMTPLGICHLCGAELVLTDGGRC